MNTKDQDQFFNFTPIIEGLKRAKTLPLEKRLPLYAVIVVAIAVILLVGSVFGYILIQYTNLISSGVREVLLNL